MRYYLDVGLASGYRFTTRYEEFNDKELASLEQQVSEIVSSGVRELYFDLNDTQKIYVNSKHIEFILIKKEVPFG